MENYYQVVALFPNQCVQSYQVATFDDVLGLIDQFKQEPVHLSVTFITPNTL